MSLEQLPVCNAGHPFPWLLSQDLYLGCPKVAWRYSGRGKKRDQKLFPKPVLLKPVKKSSMHQEPGY